MRHPTAELSLRTSELEELRKGKIVLRTAAQGTDTHAAAQGIIHVTVSPTQAWTLLEQWDRMHEVLPAARFGVLRRWADATGDRHELISAQLSAGLFKVRYALRATLRSSEFRQWWSLIAEDELEALRRELPGLPTQSRMIRRVEGSLSVHALDDGCVVQYDNHFVPHPSVPRPIQNLVSRQMLREFLTASRRELLAASSVEPACPSQGSVALDRPVERV